MTRVDLKDEIIDALELNGGQMFERELFDYLSDREGYKPENPLSDLLHDTQTERCRKHSRTGRGNLSRR